jgi:hypothetical protein
VAATSRDLKHATQDAQRVFTAEPFDHHTPRSDSLAKYAADFFKMSRSMRSSAFSRRRRDSSASTSVTSRRGAGAAVSGESARFARLTQLVNVLGESESLHEAGDAQAVSGDHLDGLLAELCRVNLAG